MLGFGNFFRCLILSVLMSLLVLLFGSLAANMFPFAGELMGTAMAFVIVFTFIVVFSNNCAVSGGFGFMSLIMWLIAFTVAYGLSIACLVMSVQFTEATFISRLFCAVCASFLPTTGFCMFSYYSMLGTGETDIQGGSWWGDTFGLLARPAITFVVCIIVCLITTLMGIGFTIAISIIGGVFGIVSIIIMRVTHGSLFY